MIKKVLVLGAAVAGLLAVRRARQGQAERELWQEATDPVR
jgi:hypothetical protein